MELGAVAVALVSGSSFLATALAKELRAIETYELALLFELANHEKNELSISELNEKMKKRAMAWDLSSPELQRVLMTAQQAQFISISSGIITINR